MSAEVTAARRFFLAPEERPERGLAVVSGGWERTAPGYRIDRAEFPYFGLEFVAGGSGRLRIDAREHRLSRGAVFTYGPGVAHSITPDPAEGLSKYFVDLEGPEARRAMVAAGLAPGTCLAVAAPDEVQAAFERLFDAAGRGTAAVGPLAALHARILLIVVGEGRLEGGGRSAQARQTFLRCREHMEQKFLTIRTAEEAAAACRVAPEYLSRLFRRFAGVPAYRFLMRLKMNHAAILLEGQVRNVGETAEVLGMDPFHFSRAFKRVHGCAPAAFLAQRARVECAQEDRDAARPGASSPLAVRAPRQ